MTATIACKRCGHTGLKGNIIRHLSRKTACEPSVSDMTPEECLREIRTCEKPRPYSCSACGVTFTCNPNRYAHQKGCLAKQEASAIQKLEMMIRQQQVALEKQQGILAKQQLEIKNMKSLVLTGVTPVINHNVQNIHNSLTINVQIRDFDNENRDAIPPSLVRDLIMDLRIPELVENLHFDRGFPENNNVRLVSLKRELMEMYKGDRWSTVPLKKGMNQMIVQACRIFRRFYNENRVDVEEDVGDPDEAAKILDAIDSIEREDGNAIRAYHDDMRAMLVGNKAAILILDAPGGGGCD